MTRPTPLSCSTRIVALVACLGILALLPACEPLKRHGGACNSNDACAWGLTCEDGHCHRQDDIIVRGLGAVMLGLPRRAALPKKVKKTPQAIGSLYQGIQGKVHVDFFESSPLPKEATLTSGETIRPSLAREALRKGFELLATSHSSLTLGESRVLPPILAERLDLQVITSGDGVPIVLGAQLRAGDAVEVIGIVSDPRDVDYAIGNALWRLKLKQETKLGVAFACIGGAFCPKSPALPEPLEGSGEWPESVSKALARVQRPFDAYRTDVKEDLTGLGIHAYAVEKYDPIPERAKVLVLAGATEALDESEEGWLREKLESGVDFLVLAPGARLRAKSRVFKPVGSGEVALLTFLGVQREHALMADRTALIRFRVPGGHSGSAAELPLAAEVSRVQEFHPAVAGLSGVLIPVAGTFSLPETGDMRPLAWTRTAASPVQLPVDATESGVRDAAPPRGSDAEAGIIAVTREVEGTRHLVFGSDFGLMGMSAPKLLAKLNLPERAKNSSADELVGDLAPFESAAKAYESVAAANRSMRRGALKALYTTILWLAEPRALRGLRGSADPDAGSE